MSEGSGPAGGPGRDADGDAAGGPARDPSRDPTRMINQPSLQTSSGRIWLIMSGLLAVASLVPLVMLVGAGGPSAPVALTTAVAVVVLYGVILVLRFAIPHRRRRLWWLAACTLMMAAIALIGVWVCALVEAA